MLSSFLFLIFDFTIQEGLMGLMILSLTHFLIDYNLFLGWDKCLVFFLIIVLSSFSQLFIAEDKLFLVRVLLWKSAVLLGIFLGFKF